MDDKETVPKFVLTMIMSSYTVKKGILRNVLIHEIISSSVVIRGIQVEQCLMNGALDNRIYHTAQGVQQAVPNERQKSHSTLTERPPLFAISLIPQHDEQSDHTATPVILMVQSDEPKFLRPLPTVGESVAGHMVTRSVIAPKAKSCQWSNQPMKFQGSVDASRNFISVSSACTQSFMHGVAAFCSCFLQQSCGILTLIMEQAYCLQRIPCYRLQQ